MTRQFPPSALVRGAAVDLHVAIGFLLVVVNNFSGNHVERHIPLAAALAKPGHELLANEIGELIRELEGRLPGSIDQGFGGSRRPGGRGIRRGRCERRRVRTGRERRLLSSSQNRRSIGASGGVPCACDCVRSGDAEGADGAGCDCREDPLCASRETETLKASARSSSDGSRSRRLNVRFE